MKFSLLIDGGLFHLVNVTAPTYLQPCIVHTCDSLSEAIKTLGVINYCAQVDAEREAKERGRPQNRIRWFVPCLN